MDGPDPRVDCKAPTIPQRSPLRPKMAVSETTKVLTKRQHALLELLESERAYCSDLALVRDVHIPMALGQPVALHPSPPSSASSSQRQSAASDSSDGPPMTLEDTKIIFNNIVELAIFSDMLCDSLDAAVDDDRVGELFLRIVR